jgi:FixJ family two-component response regulator
MTEPFTVYVVDDDAGILKAMTRLLRAHGFEVQPYASPQAFLENHDPTVPGCAILDVAMPGLDGLALQGALATTDYRRPIVFLTGRGDVPTSVRAMKAGALDFLIKPAKEMDLLQAVRRAEATDVQARRTRSELAAIQSRLSTLTRREREVLSHVISGRLNKQIAGDLGTVEKTIKVHRGRMMVKLGVRSVADLVRLAERAGVSAAPKG